MNGPACFVWRLLSMCLVTAIAATPTLHAQTQTPPAADMSVAVRMVDAVNSAKDPAGKQYRASVAKAVDFGNGVTIPQDALAYVRLVDSGNGSGFTTQLVSVMLKGKPVAIASSSVSATSASNAIAVKAMNSALAGLGHHVNAPTGTAPVATGQQVTLPRGTTVTFVLAQRPAPSPVVSAAQPAIASPAPAPSTASGPATTLGAGGGGAVTGMDICFSNPPPSGSDPNHNTEYLTAAFEVPLDARGRMAAVGPPFADYLKATYHARLNVTCQDIWTVADAREAQKKIASDHGPKVKLVDTGWRYGQSPLAQGQKGFDPLAPGAGGLDLTQHRLTTYFCALSAKGGTAMAQTDPTLTNQANYVSPLFQADWNSAVVDRAFDVYMRDHYVHDLDLSDASSRCQAQSPAMQPKTPQLTMKFPFGHTVAVDFTDTPAQAAAGNAAAGNVAAGSVATMPTAAAATAAPTLGPGGYYVFCYSDVGASVIYFSDVFAGEPDSHVGDPRQFTFGKISARFFAILQQKYAYRALRGSAVCQGRPRQATPAQRDKQVLEDKYKNRKIVETGWKDAS